jgi:hypothetical protein
VRTKRQLSERRLSHRAGPTPFHGLPFNSARRIRTMLFFATRALAVGPLQEDPWVKVQICYTFPATPAAQAGGTP